MHVVKETSSVMWTVLCRTVVCLSEMGYRYTVSRWQVTYLMKVDTVRFGTLHYLTWRKSVPLFSCMKMLQYIS